VKLVLLVLLVLLTSCQTRNEIERSLWVDDIKEYCYEGVTYISIIGRRRLGVSVKFNKNGDVVTCKGKWVNQ